MGYCADAHELVYRCSYGLAGALHIAWPAPFLTITPAWVPHPASVIVITGLCELVGTVGLWNRRLSRAAGIGLAVYAVCVYPANIKHAVDALYASNGSALRWLYHGPRLALQPVLVWLPLFAVGLITWPFGRALRDKQSTPREHSAFGGDLPDQQGSRSMEDTPSLKLAKKYLSLGGTRKAKIDDNITDTRKWDDEPQEAATFWKKNIETLADDERKQVEDFLPSINDQ